jgi:hypothetical protein
MRPNHVLWGLLQLPRTTSPLVKVLDASPSTTSPGAAWAALLKVGCRKIDTAALAGPALQPQEYP